MTLDIGIEIEFIPLDYFIFFKTLIDKNIIFVFSPQQNTPGVREFLLIKPEVTVLGGIEINIPPTYTYEELYKLCEVLKESGYTITDKCALHIHFKPRFELSAYAQYYLARQEIILSEAKEKGLYAALNDPLTAESYDDTNRRNRRAFNLNIHRAYTAHGTIEHRIYKSTLDYNEIIWCINQTKKIRDLL